MGKVIPWHMWFAAGKISTIEDCNEVNCTPASGHCVIIQVAWVVDPFALPSSVLANDYIVQAQLLHALQHLHLLIPNVLCVQTHLRTVNILYIVSSRCLITTRMCCIVHLLDIWVWIPSAWNYTEACLT